MAVEASRGLDVYKQVHLQPTGVRRCGVVIADKSGILYSTSFLFKFPLPFDLNVGFKGPERKAGVFPAALHTTLHYTALHYILLYYTVLYCTSW
jgi:hypothetical protein